MGTMRETKPTPGDRRRAGGGSRVSVRLATAALVGVVAGAAASAVLAWQAAELIGWVVASGIYLADVWLRVRRLDAEQTEAAAVREDPSVPAAELVVVSCAVACLGGVGAALLAAGRSSGATKAGFVALGVLGVLSAWATVHTVYTLRYARLYYSSRSGGIDFKSTAAPSYGDFAYVAFTVGMTFQVADTDLTAPRLRRAVLRHALISYLFGAVIVGLTINVVAGLLR